MARRQHPHPRTPTYPPQRSHHEPNGRRGVRSYSGHAPLRTEQQGLGQRARAWGVLEVGIAGMGGRGEEGVEGGEGCAQGRFRQLEGWVL